MEPSPLREVLAGEPHLLPREGEPRPDKGASLAPRRARWQSQGYRLLRLGRVRQVLPLRQTVPRHSFPERKDHRLNGKQDFLIRAQEGGHHLLPKAANEFVEQHWIQVRNCYSFIEGPYFAPPLMLGGLKPVNNYLIIWIHSYVFLTFMKY